MYIYVCMYVCVSVYMCVCKCVCVWFMRRACWIRRREAGLWLCVEYKEGWRESQVGSFACYSCYRSVDFG